MTVELHDEPTGAPITLADNDTHGGVTDDLLEAAAAAAFAPSDEAAETSPDEDEGTAAGDAGATGEGDGREGVPTPSPAPEEDFVELADGVRVQRDELIQWVQFGQFLRENPEYAAGVEAVLSGERESAPTAASPALHPAGVTGEAAAPQPPEGLDLDDPQIAALWNQHVQTLATIDRLEANVTHLDSYVQNAQVETTQSLLNTARATYQTANNLSDTEMQTVYDVAGRLQVLPALLSPTDPITGVPRQVDPLAAMQEAFELARWNIPELREREMKLKADEAKADTKRKQKLSSLGGSSGSVPKTQPEPKNAQERRAAMIAEVAAMYNGEGAS